MQSCGAEESVLFLDKFHNIVFWGHDELLEKNRKDIARYRAKYSSSLLHSMGTPNHSNGSSPRSDIFSILNDNSSNENLSFTPSTGTAMLSSSSSSSSSKASFSLIVASLFARETLQVGLFDDQVSSSNLYIYPIYLSYLSIHPSFLILSFDYFYNVGTLPFTLRNQ